MPARFACIFLGAPGSGKGTQAKRLETRLKIPHISTGDMLRQEVKRESSLGKRVKEVLASGQLVSDDLMLDVLRARLGESDAQSGFILDGYPRNIPQAEALEKLLENLGIKDIRVLYLRLSRDVLVRRLVGRLSCSQCGSVFHSEFNKPKSENICDFCGATPLHHRTDDNEDTAVQRLEVYESQTQPLIERYRLQRRLTEIDASAEMLQVESDINRAVSNP